MELQERDRAAALHKIAAQCPERVSIFEFKRAISTNQSEQSYPTILDRYLIENSGESINHYFITNLFTNSHTPISYAVAFRNTQAISSLIAAGANLNTMDCVDYVGELSSTTLVESVFKLHEKTEIQLNILQLLYQHGAVINFTDFMQAGYDFNSEREKIIFSNIAPVNLHLRQIYFENIFASEANCDSFINNFRRQNDTDVEETEATTSDTLSNYIIKTDVNEVHCNKTLLIMMLKLLNTDIVTSIDFTKKCTVALELILRLMKPNLNQKILALNGLSPFEYVTQDSFRNKGIKKLSAFTIAQLHKEMKDPASYISRLSSDVITYHIAPFFDKRDPFIVNKSAPTAPEESEATRAAMSPSNN